MLRRNSKVMLYSYEDKKISDSIKALLIDNGVEFTSEQLLPRLALNHQRFLREYVLLPNETGILTGLGFISYKSRSLPDAFCADIKNVLENITYHIPDYVMDMKIFTDRHGRKVSIRESYIVESNDVPPGFTESPWNVSFVITTNVSQRLQEKLPFRRMMFNDLIKQYINCHKHKTLTVADSNFFIEKISSIRHIDNDLIFKLKSSVQIKTESGSEEYVYSLFERTSKLEDFFCDEKNIFPCESYSIETLRKLGLKSELEITKSDIIDRINYVNRNGRLMSSQNCGRKVKAILTFCVENNISLPQSTHWIPIEKTAPPEYPTSLYWRASSASELIQSFQNLYSLDYFQIVGSTSYVVSRSLSKIFSSFVYKRPSLNHILNHLQNVVQFYNDDERGKYKDILRKIYKYLGETCRPEEVAKNWKQLNLKLWQGHQFIAPGQITLLEGCLDLSPYMYQPKGDFPDSFKTILKCICDQNERVIDVYIHVLSKIKQHYDEVDAYSPNDLALSIKLLGIIAENYSQLNQVQKESVYIPIEHKFLKFCNLKDCFYHDHVDEFTGSDLKKYKIAHCKLDKTIIEVFEIPDLVSEILTDDEIDSLEDFEQTEPLTLRLKRLLKDYEDGLPIFKELIQNADDANATEISFLYDERSNDDLTSSLIDQSMKSWHGPALWVHNDSVFTKEDFENIKKLNAATKASDTTKIGKFGLGFNSVYHLTDVPCFLSGNHIVYFDPHSKYLRRAFQQKNNTRGKRINLKMNKDLIQFNDQFKIFDGVFKARVDFEKHDFEIYSNTLFRLPLRNLETASKSDICNTNYSKEEMELLLDKLKESLETLILFTENIQKISVYHLEQNASPSQMTRMFSVRKEANTRSSNLINQNLLVSATRQIEKYAITQQLPADSLTGKRVMYIDMVYNLNENLINEPVTKRWLQLAFTGSKKNISFAVRNPGLVPCGGLAINYRRSDKRFEIVTDKNRVFCFLPLPKESNLPVSVNGSFLITNDRKQLAVNSDEIKRNPDDWNLMLAADIGRAYFELLLYIKDTFLHYGRLEDWYGLFPASDQVNLDVISNAISSSLVNNLIHSDERLFPVANNKDDIVNWKRLEDIRGPPKSLDCMNNAILVFMNWFTRKTN